MKKCICLFFMLVCTVCLYAQTVGDKPTRFMMRTGAGVMMPLKNDFLGDIGLRRVLPALSGGFQYYFNENWGASLEIQVASLLYVNGMRTDFYRKEYIPDRYQEMALKTSRYSMESNLIGAGALYRKRISRVWLEGGLFVGAMTFEPHIETSHYRPVYYKEEGTNLLYEHRVSGPDEVISFVVSPQISAQYKLNSRLGLEWKLGVMQPFRKVDYTMTLRDVFYKENLVHKPYEGKINAPLLFSRLALICNFKAIKGKNR